MKEDIINFALQYKDILAKCKITDTGTTGSDDYNYTPQNVGYNFYAPSYRLPPVNSFRMELKGTLVTSMGSKKERRFSKRVTTL